MHLIGRCFEVGPSGYFTFHALFEPKIKCTTLGVLGGHVDKVAFFDEGGMKWRIKHLAAPFPRSWWRLLLAHTIYNPWIYAEPTWGTPRKYIIDDLKSEYLKAIKTDDDILTQFVDRNELIRRVQIAQSFTELVEVYTWMETDNTQNEN